MTEKPKITTKVLEDVVKSSSADAIPLDDLIEAMNAVGFGLVMMIFAFGAIIPLPPPLPSISAIPLVVFSLQMVRGYTSPKLPHRLANIKIKRSVLAALVQKSSVYIGKVERILRPRLSFMTSQIGERVVGFFALIFSSFILIPLPLSNFIPGLGVLIISFGLLGKDGIVVIAGIITGIIGVSVSIGTFLLGAELLYYLKGLFW
jgi:hypothetical protein